MIDAAASVTELVDAYWTTDWPDDAAKIAHLEATIAHSDFATGLEGDEASELREQLHMALLRARRFERALEVVRERNAAGWNAIPDGQTDEAALLIFLGEAERGGELYERLLGEADHGAWWVANHAGGTYADVGDHDAAVDWYGRCIRLALDAEDPDGFVAEAAAWRAQSLRALDREDDDIQREAAPLTEQQRDKERTSMARFLEREERQAIITAALLAALDDVDGEPRPSRGDERHELVAAFLSADDARAALEAWPGDYETLVSGDAAEDARRLEHRMQFLAAGSRLDGLVVPRWIAVVTVEDLRDAASALETPVDEQGEAKVRARAARVALDAGRATPWPPARNDRCWCRSGRKYKQCCGTVALDSEERADAPHEVVWMLRRATDELSQMVHARAGEVTGRTDLEALTLRNAELGLDAGAGAIDRMLATLTAWQLDPVSFDAIDHDLSADEEFQELIGEYLFTDLLDVAERASDSVDARQALSMLGPALRHPCVASNVMRGDLLRLSLGEALAMSDLRHHAVEVCERVLAEVAARGAHVPAVVEACAIANLVDVDRAADADQRFDALAQRSLGADREVVLKIAVDAFDDAGEDELASAWHDRLESLARQR